MADDKAMYCYVPELIAYYLNEQTSLESVPTYRTSDEAEARIVLDRIGELVTKPVDGHGGIGVLIGPDSPAAEVAERRATIAANPAGWVAQEVVALSSHPTIDGDPAAAPACRPASLRLRPRHRAGGLYAGRSRPDPGRPQRQPGGQLLPGRRGQGHLDHRERARGDNIVCGLAGEIRFDGRYADVPACDRVAARLAPRGPDGCGLWARGPIALGHRRLSIIDLSAAGSQPMVDSPLGLAVVFNGCIYNYRQLRTELEGYGHRFFSTSDTEVIGKAYAQWGVACVDHFFGMFAFAIAEQATGRLILGRDRLGIKPLYLDQTPDRLRFASTLPALLAGGGTDTSIDMTALAYYMTFHSVVPAPRTILTGIRKLPPATVRVVEPDGRHTDHHYWEPVFAPDPDRADWTEQDWQSALLDSLRVAVDRRMVADVPVGVLLSGGIDSSLVVALLAEAGQTGLATFSIGFESAGGESG